MPLVQTRGAASAQGFGEFAQASAVNYIEDVFSCFLYTGNGSTQTITNGIDLAGKGGLVVIKGRNTPTGSSAYGGAANQFTWQDTVRGITQTLCSNRTDAQLPAGGFASNSSISSSGFILDYNGYNDYNRSPNTYVSWTFRKQPKFFDVVTYTGNGANRTIAHNLGSVPGFIIVKRTDTTADWAVYHRSLANTQYLVLNSTAAAATGATWWNSTTPTSAVFSLGTDASVNASGGTYVAYIYAHDAGGFGLTGTDNVISCGSFNGAVNTEVTLGYEPQWIMFKNATGGSNWQIIDNMRGMPVGSDDRQLMANLANAESDNGLTTITATGFTWLPSASGNTYIYIAIRRGPMKVPTLGTSVFAPIIRTGTSTATSISGVGFPPDMMWSQYRNSAGNDNVLYDKLRGSVPTLFKNLTIAEVTGVPSYGIDSFDQNGVSLAGNQSYTNNSGTDFIYHFMRRAPSFFDVVCYTGDGTANRSITHNLGVIPEFYITRARSGSSITIFKWGVYSSYTGLTQVMQLSLTNAAATDNWWGTNPLTATSFSVSGNDPAANNSTGSYVAYLFATCAGVSKVGSYTGTGALQTINCGFTGGARLVLIKRTDSTGNWWVYDSARGITSGNDPYLYLNSTAAEVTSTNYVDTDSTGFKVTAAAPAELNASGGTYIFLAIA